MIKHFGRDDSRNHRWNLAFYWARRPLRERLDGESYWQGKFVLAIEPPRIYRRRQWEAPWIFAERDASAWTGRSREIAAVKFGIGLYVRSPGGFEKEWSFQR